MKKTIFLLTLIVASLLTTFLFTSCNNQNGIINDNGSQTTEGVSESTAIQITAEIPGYMSNVGLTFNELKELYPSYEYLWVSIPNAAAICFGDTEKNFSYYFFGSHDRPGLDEITSEYGDLLKCAGVYTNVRQFFPFVEDSLSVSDFFALIDVDDYTVWGPSTAEGWISFEYMGYMIELKPYRSPLKSDYIPPEEIKKGDTILIYDKELSSYNFGLHAEVMNAWINELKQN